MLITGLLWIFEGSLLILYGLGYWVRKARQAGLRQTKLLKSLLSHLTDVLHSIKPLKAMGRENLAESVLMKETNRLNKALKKQVIVKEALRASQEGTRTIFLAAGLYVALMVWRLPFITVMMLIFLLARFLVQIGKVQHEYQEMATLDSAYWSLRKTIAEEMLLKYNGMLIGVFDLLADAREQIGSVIQSIDAQRDFWLADAALQATLIGRPAAAPALESAAAVAASAAKPH